MRLRKTHHNKQTTYTYFRSCTDENGVMHIEKVILRPGENEVTELNIKQLHSADDKEVVNNIKNLKYKPQKWDKPIYTAWKRDHPDANPPSLWAVSIEGSSTSSEGENYGDKASILANFAVYDEDEVSPAVERLREIIESCTPQQQELYAKVVIVGIPMVTIAKQEGVSETAIRHRMAKIYAKIEKDEILRDLLGIK